MTAAPTTQKVTLPSGKRWYDWRGERYWSVTTIIGSGVPKPALLPWGIKMVVEGAADLADTLPALVKQDREAAVKMLKGLPYAHRDRAANLGTLIHATIEAHRLGKPMPPPPADVAGHMRAFERFLADFTPEYLATEAPVFNRTQKYAGTLDAIVRLKLPTSEVGDYILDVKSGKNIYPEVGLQLAAYRHAEFIGLPDGDEKPMPACVGALGLHLTATGYRLIEVRADEEVFQTFLYVREVFRFLESTSKTILGVEYRDGNEEVAA
jgi:hypothetical protein